MNASANAPASARKRRYALWVLLVSLLLVAQSTLVWLAFRYELTQEQGRVEQVAAGAAGDIRQSLNRDLQSLQALLWAHPTRARWQADAAELLRGRRELLRIERRNRAFEITEAVDSPYRPPSFTRLAREDLDVETEVACASAQRFAGPAYSRSYFVPLADGLGVEAIDVCLPVLEKGAGAGHLVAVYALSGLLTEAISPDNSRGYEIAFVEGDGTRLARSGSVSRGKGVYVAQRLLDLSGLTLQLRVDSAAGEPDLVPNLLTALVLGLSLALSGVVLLLVRDVRKRGLAERSLAEALAFRKAMEDSVVTGLRARDAQGRISYVNPAFCQMVGFSAQELIGQSLPPYWPPEMVDEYRLRQAARWRGVSPPRDGFETIFMHKNGERFPVVVFEAPLIDAGGQQTGWMSAVLDVREQRRVEELSRQQQEKLQATARLATVGEMASLLSHELNQPLAAISSYATGSLNVMQGEGPDAGTLASIRQALVRIAEQAERAGRVIKSVHSFVRRREQSREAIRVDELFDAVLPLVRLQARKSGTRIELKLPVASQRRPAVRCDRTMIEQVLLNLTRNAIQAMESGTPPEARVLQLEVRQPHRRWVEFLVRDHGAGIPAEVAQRLYTPFFTTKPEGMGLGLSLCRTVVEQHGGALTFEAPPPEQGGGTLFRFTLPADTGSARAAAVVGAASSAPSDAVMSDPQGTQA